MPSASNNAGHSSRAASPLVRIRDYIRCGNAVGGLLSRFLWFSACWGVHGRLNQIFDTSCHLTPADVSVDSGKPPPDSPGGH